MRTLPAALLALWILGGAAALGVRAEGDAEPGAAASQQEEKAEPPRPHTDAQLKEYEVFEKFEAGWESKDLGERIRALKTLGRWRHKRVLKELKKIWSRESDMELLAAAAQGLGEQTPFAKDAGKALVKRLDTMYGLASREDPEGDEELAQRLESQAIVAGLRGVAQLGYKNGWDDLKRYIDHNDDNVAAEMMLACGRLKEYRALPLILEWFNFYPDGASWSGGSVTVHTGDTASADTARAKAKWKAKYGRRKHKARPQVWERMVEAVELLTGEKMSKPEELKAWMDENKLFLKKQGA